jgi:hypothetical protein
MRLAEVKEAGARQWFFDDQNRVWRMLSPFTVADNRRRSSRTRACIPGHSQAPQTRLSTAATRCLPMNPWLVHPANLAGHSVAIGQARDTGAV